MLRSHGWPGHAQPDDGFLRHQSIQPPGAGLGRDAMPTFRRANIPGSCWCPPRLPGESLQGVGVVSNAAPALLHRGATTSCGAANALASGPGMALPALRTDPWSVPRNGTTGHLMVERIGKASASRQPFESSAFSLATTSNASAT